MKIDKDEWKMIIEFALLVAVMMLAYNVGQYDSLQYQAMYEVCEDCQEYCNQNNPFADMTINLNKTLNQTNDHG